MARRVRPDVLRPYTPPTPRAPQSYLPTSRSQLGAWGLGFGISGLLLGPLLSVPGVILGVIAHRRGSSYSVVAIVVSASTLALHLLVVYPMLRATRGTTSTQATSGPNTASAISPAPPVVVPHGGIGQHTPAQLLAIIDGAYSGAGDDSGSYPYELAVSVLTSRTTSSAQQVADVTANMKQMLKRDLGRNYSCLQIMEFVANTIPEDGMPRWSYAEWATVWYTVFAGMEEKR